MPPRSPAHVGPRRAAAWENLVQRDHRQQHTRGTPDQDDHDRPCGEPDKPLLDVAQAQQEHFESDELPNSKAFRISSMSSQKVSRCSRVLSDIADARPWFPMRRPATTAAMGGSKRGSLPRARSTPAASAIVEPEISTRYRSSASTELVDASAASNPGAMPPPPSIEEQERRVAEVRARSRCVATPAIVRKSATPTPSLNRDSPAQAHLQPCGGLDLFEYPENRDPGPVGAIKRTENERVDEWKLDAEQLRKGRA